MIDVEEALLTSQRLVARYRAEYMKQGLELPLVDPTELANFEMIVRKSARKEVLVSLVRKTGTLPLILRILAWNKRRQAS